MRRMRDSHDLKFASLRVGVKTGATTTARDVVQIKHYAIHTACACIQQC